MCSGCLFTADGKVFPRESFPLALGTDHFFCPYKTMSPFTGSLLFGKRIVFLTSYDKVYRGNFMDLQSCNL